MSLRPSRRDVLKGGAAAGLSLGLGDFTGVLRQALAAPACGSLNDIEHVVIFMQENRSFDHYFGRYKGVRGFDDRSVRLFPGDDGTAVFRQPSPNSVPGPHPLTPFQIDTSGATPGRQGDCINDIQHQWADEHAMWNQGAMDQWVKRHVTTNGAAYAPVTMGYYDASPTRDGSGEMDFYWALADNFTICDNYFCSVLGGTDANRLYSMTGTMDPDAYDGGLQFLDTGVSLLAAYDLGTAKRWVPYPEVLDAHRNASGAAAPITWKVYGSPDQPSGVSDNVLRYFPQYRLGTGNPGLATKAFAAGIADFAADALAGRLPQVSWVLVDAVDSEHAPAPTLYGEDTTHTLVTLLMASPLWPKLAMFLTYDENGGFFDHVPPPTPPVPPDPMAAGEYLDLAKLSQHSTARSDAGAYATQPIGLGFRVPTLVISPFSRNPNPQAGPMVCSDQFDHTSLLKFLERRFGAEIPSRDPRAPGGPRPGISPWRRDPKNIGDLTSAFNFAAGANTSAPSLPGTSHADPRSVAECPVTALTLGTATFTAGYPVPAAPPFPRQEVAAGPVVRPSGLCGAATTTASQPTGPGPVGPIFGGTPTTGAAAPPSATGAAILAGGVLLAGWWARRRAGSPS
ncbi:MAG: alkaline phosphatase family protein [Candidatus Dormibacteria bacterium]